MAKLPSVPLPQPTTQEITGDSKALREEEALEKGYDLENQETQNAISALRRADGIETHFHIILIIGVYSVSAIGLIMFAILVWHEVAPASYRYLTGDQVSDLSKFLFTGTVGAGLKSGVSRLRQG